jgi:hypothetical protein
LEKKMGKFWVKNRLVSGRNLGVKRIHAHTAQAKAFAPLTQTVAIFGATLY